jgi:hypothetical protein
VERIARMSAGERADLMRVAADRKRTRPAVVEKDFWVCWTLRRLFADPDMAAKILFKGSTSLSKVFGLIERFSEDVDLILDWNEITKDNPRAQRSRSKQEVFRNEFLGAAARYLRETFLPEIQRIVGDVCTAVILDNPEVVQVKYPALFEDDYLRAEIQLEVGPMAAWLPNEQRPIRSYLAEVLPSMVLDAECTVNVIKVERTFWEKVTILHAEAHRPENNPQPAGYSRHYYDVFRMARAKVKADALADLELLRAVVEFKNKFYYRGWARYDIAVPGSMKLIPAAHVMDQVRRDYDEMGFMIFGERPKFDDMMAGLGELEAEINAV